MSKSSRSHTELNLLIRPGWDATTQNFYFAIKILLPAAWNAAQTFYCKFTLNSQLSFAFSNLFFRICWERNVTFFLLLSSVFHFPSWKYFCFLFLFYSTISLIFFPFFSSFMLKQLIIKVTWKPELQRKPCSLKTVLEKSLLQLDRSGGLERRQEMKMSFLNHLPHIPP